MEQHKPKAYGVVGNRKGFSWDYIESKLDTFDIQKDDIIISGGAEGVDSYAEQYAKEKGCSLIVHLPDKRLPVVDRYFARNLKIVQDSDIVIAFSKIYKSGTSNTISQARKLGKTVVVFDGN